MFFVIVSGNVYCYHIIIISESSSEYSQISSPPTFHNLLTLYLKSLHETYYTQIFDSGKMSTLSAHRGHGIDPDTFDDSKLISSLKLSKYDLRIISEVLNSQTVLEDVIQWKGEVPLKFAPFKKVNAPSTIAEVTLVSALLYHFQVFVEGLNNKQANIKKTANTKRKATSKTLSASNPLYYFSGEVNESVFGLFTLNFPSFPVDVSTSSGQTKGSTSITGPSFTSILTSILISFINISLIESQVKRLQELGIVPVILSGIRGVCNE
jgi:hypothetical protein